jgi:hypothetical protein
MEADIPSPFTLDSELAREKCRVLFLLLWLAYISRMITLVFSFFIPLLKQSFLGFVVSSTLDFYIVVFWFVTPYCIFVEGVKYFWEICKSSRSSLKFSHHGIMTKTITI